MTIGDRKGCGSIRYKIKFLKNKGTSGETYICTMEVTTAIGDQEVFTLRWTVL